MKLYGAIDLHSNDNVTVIRSEKKRILLRRKVCANWSVFDRPGHAPLFSIGRCRILVRTSHPSGSRL